MKKNYFVWALSAMAVFGPMMLASCGGSQKVSQVKADDAVEIKNVPCSDCLSTRELVRAMSMRESMDQQMAKEMARSSALDELAAKVNVAVSAVVVDYRNSRSVNMSEEAKRRFEGATVQLVDQSLSGWRTICEKYTLSTRPDGTKVYKCYYAVEIGKDELAASLYKGLSNDQSLRLDYDYQKFMEEFSNELLRADKNR